MTTDDALDDERSTDHRRAEDRNPWAKAAVLADRYKILWIAGMALAAWIGNRVVQPLNTISEVAASQAALTTRVTAAERTQADMAHAVLVLTKIVCVKNLTPADQYAFGVTCLDLPSRKDP